jgi:thioredoxin-dependent peroxiredoxin
MAIITFQGKAVNTNGQLPGVGSPAPDFMLTNRKLQDVTLAEFAGKRKILNIVPSLDTPTCQASTRKFNEKAVQFENTVVLAISADLPFAQARFCEVEGIKNVQALSCFRSDFAKTYGVELLDSILAGLTARAVLVLNENNLVIYSELVSELANEPDYSAALAALSA